MARTKPLSTTKRNIRRRHYRNFRKLARKNTILKFLYLSDEIEKHSKLIEQLLFYFYMEGFFAAQPMAQEALKIALAKLDPIFQAIDAQHGPRPAHFFEVMAAAKIM